MAENGGTRGCWRSLGSGDRCRRRRGRRRLRCGNYGRRRLRSHRRRGWYWRNRLELVLDDSSVDSQHRLPLVVGGQLVKRLTEIAVGDVVKGYWSVRLWSRYGRGRSDLGSWNGPACCWRRWNGWWRFPGQCGLTGLVGRLKTASKLLHPRLGDVKSKQRIRDVTEWQVLRGNISCRALRKTRGDVSASR